MVEETEGIVPPPALPSMKKRLSSHRQDFITQDGRNLTAILNESAYSWLKNFIFILGNKRRSWGCVPGLPMERAFFQKPLWQASASIQIVDGDPSRSRDAEEHRNCSCASMTGWPYCPFPWINWALVPLLKVITYSSFDSRLYRTCGSSVMSSYFNGIAKCRDGQSHSFYGT